MRRWWWLLLVLVLAWPAAAHASDVGGPIFRDVCTQIPQPVTNKVLCWEQTTAQLRTWNGTSWTTVSVIGGGGSVTPGTYTKVTVNATGSVTAGAQAALTELSGLLGATQFPGLTGDVTAAAGGTVTTLSATGVVAGIYGQVTVDAKGRVTAGTAVTPMTWGGTGVSTAVDNSVLVSSGTAWQTKAVPSCSGANEALNYTDATNAFGCVTVSGTGGIASLGGQTGSTQLFANDTNITITSASNTHTLGFTGTLGRARGGWGQSVAAVTGVPSFSAGTPTFNATLPATLGGTGIATPFFSGALIYATSTTTLGMRQSVNTGQVLVSKGLGVAPEWSADVRATTLALGGGPACCAEPFDLQGGGAGISFWDRVGGQAERWVIYSTRITPGTAGTQAFRWWNGADRMILTGAGNVGIGVADPGVRLAVAGAGELTSSVKVTSGVSTTSTTAALVLEGAVDLGLLLRNTAANAHLWSFINTGPASGLGSGLHLYDFTVGGLPGDRLKIDDNGRVVVYAQMHVGTPGGTTNNGDINITGCYRVNGTCLTLLTATENPDWKGTGTRQLCVDPEGRVYPGSPTCS